MDSAYRIAVFVRPAGGLDHAVQRDLFDDPDLSHGVSFHTGFALACGRRGEQGRGTSPISSCPTVVAGVFARFPTHMRKSSPSTRRRAPHAHVDSTANQIGNKYPRIFTRQPPALTSAI